MHCPVCGGPVEKLHRHALERFISIFYSVHRYRCTRVGCGWEGAMHRDGSVSSTIKGNMWKGPFHLPRMELYCWKLLEEMK